MPYQLIYTSAAQLLDSPLSGYGVVARSENMPTVLVRSLIELSEYKEPAEQGISGPQFSYRIEECGNRLYHIFTSVRAAGADYSKRSCHLAHHLILRDDEMHALCRSAAPPTPAGILLSLELRRFWLHRWQREPEYLTEEAMPPLWENPATTNFPTWLIFTGKGENARAFQTPPYHQGCLVLVPQKTQANDILRLLHESYSLAPTLGWGIPFCTYSVENDTLDSHRRLFTIAGSALHQRALRMGFPTLDITPGLILPAPPAAEPPTSQPVSPIPSVPPLEPHATPATAPQAAATPSAPTLATLPTLQSYLYVESQENDTFEQPWRRERRKLSTINLIYGAAALILLSALVISLLIGSPGESTPQPTTTQVEQELSEAPTLKDLPPLDIAPSNLAHKPLDPAEPETNSSTAPGGNLATLIPPTGSDEQDSPGKDSSTDSLPTDESDILPAGVDMPADEIDLTDEGDTPPPPAPEQEEDLTPPAETDSRRFTESKTYHSVIVGGELPDVLYNLLPPKGEQVTLSHGTYAFHAAHEPNSSQSQFTYKKGQKHYQLKLSPQETDICILCHEPGSYSIITHDNKTPTLRLRLTGKRLDSVTTQDGAVAAAQLPVDHESKPEWIPVFLLPHIEVTVAPNTTQPACKNIWQNNQGIPFLSLKNLDTALTKDKKTNKYGIELSVLKKSADMKIDRSITLLPLSAKLYLPGLLDRENTIIAKGEKNSISITGKPDKKDDFCTINLEASQTLHPAERVKERFDEYFTKKWDDKAYSTFANALERIYSLYKNFPKTYSTQNTHLQKYRELYYCENLGTLLRKIYQDRNDGDLAYSSGISFGGQRRVEKNEDSAIFNSIKALGKTKLIKDILEHLNDKLDQFVRESQRELNAAPIPRHILKLKDVRYIKGEKKFQWIFELTQDQ